MPTPARIYKNTNRIAAVTLIELLVVISILSISVLAVLFTYNTSRGNQALRVSAEKFADNVKATNLFARNARDKSDWVIKNTSNSEYTIISYPEGIETVRERYSLESQTIFPDNFEVTFAIGTGNPDGEKVVSIQNSRGKRIEVQITSSGNVEVGELIP